MIPEYVNIISKEAVTSVPVWSALLGWIVSCLPVLSTLVYWVIVKNPNKATRYLGIAGVITIIITIAWVCVSCIFFSEPTGQYNYKATIDKDNITVAEYEQFIKEYHPDIKDDVYYFTAGEFE